MDSQSLQGSRLGVVAVLASLTFPMVTAAQAISSSEVAKEGKFSGLMFGDYYWYDRWHQDQVSSSNPTAVEGQQGFWLRRIYFTYDLALGDNFTTRFRLEANSDGQFAGGNLTTYVKDAWLRWTYHGQQHAALGLQPSLAFDWLDTFWGLRHIEKTPVDLYRIDASRDLGVTFGGPVAIHGLTYAAQFGNDSGHDSETDQYKILRFEGRYERNPGIVLEGFYSYSDRPGGQDRYTAQAFAGFHNEIGRAGAQFVWQERESGADNMPDQRIDIWSGFGIWDVLAKKAGVFLRVDRVQGDLGGVDTGLPGADGIDYLLLSAQSAFTTWIFGGEWYVHPSVRVGPNLELVKYDNDPDPVNFPGRDVDRIYRITFYWTL